MEAKKALMFHEKIEKNKKINNTNKRSFKKKLKHKICLQKYNTIQQRPWW